MSSFALDKQLTIKTQLSVSETEELLTKYVRSTSLIWPLGDKKRYLFSGTVSNGRFNLRRIIPYRSVSFQRGTPYRTPSFDNIFDPVITGKFHNDLDTTRIEIDIRSSHIALLFFLVFLPITLLSFFAAPLYMGVLLLLVFAVIIANINANVRRTQVLLEAIFSS